MLSGHVAGFVVVHDSADSSVVLHEVMQEVVGVNRGVWKIERRSIHMQDKCAVTTITAVDISVEHRKQIPAPFLRLV